MWPFTTLVRAINQLTDAVWWLIEAVIQLEETVGELVAVLKKPPNPRPITIKVLKESGNMLNFEINLPAEPADGDVASGELTVSVGTGGASVVPTLKGQSSVTGFSGEHGDRVVASFAYIDDAGNKSTTPATLDVTLADTFPPADPAALGLTVTGETA